MDAYAAMQEVSQHARLPEADNIRSPGLECRLLQSACHSPVVGITLLY